MSEYRICKVQTDEGEKKALFHKFITKNDAAHAIIELEDGSIAITPYRNIKFTNSKTMINIADRGEKIMQEYNAEFMKKQFNLNTRNKM